MAQRTIRGRVIDDDEIVRISDEIRKDEILYLKKEKEAFEQEKEVFERERAVFEREREAFEQEKAKQEIPIETLVSETLSEFDELVPKLREKLIFFVQKYKFRPDIISLFVGRVSYDDNPLISKEMRKKYNYKTQSVKLENNRTFIVKSSSRNRVKDEDGVSERVVSYKDETLYRL